MLLDKRQQLCSGGLPRGFHLASQAWAARAAAPAATAAADAAATAAQLRAPLGLQQLLGQLLPVCGAEAGSSRLTGMDPRRPHCNWGRGQPGSL